ncbi:GTP 3',8-cyclase MoaA [Candidatus Acetothermia bacterium]|nr:GTP 3',8-cyclase MoaA [Candidatus Acetothermia bacterium]MBI3461199.1 GTP 3',8-cyclase MoaA [Candidatus Acetothermia bacterium]MBI3658878.1 GTP 3',8-cyclase MoaA [Candidatus Acetothermia bacterium]
MKDRFGREHNYLRISVIDRCNQRCHFCMPMDMQFFSPKDVLTFEEIVTVVKVGNKLGIDRVRITGGEPTVRPNLPTLIRMLKAETDVKDISMTTNGMLLERFAQSLKDAGLDRVNVSLHSLNAEKFRRLTRLGDLEVVMRGIRKAMEVGLTPLKFNALILQGFNDDEIDDLFKLTLQDNVTMRFLELMPIGEAMSLDGFGSYLNLTKVREWLTEKYRLVPVEETKGNGPARYWKAPGAPGKVGFITPISHKYCDTCSRMRLTANGEIRPCLAYDVHVSIRDAIRRGDLAAIEAGLKEALWMKPKGHHWEEGQTTQTVMSTLGG